MKETTLDIPPCPKCGCARRIDETIAMVGIRVSCGCRWCNNTEQERFVFRMLGRDRYVTVVTDDHGRVVPGARSAAV